MNEAEVSNPRFFDIVGSMRAIRRLRPDPVPLEMIRRVLDAGVKAPSGMNTQPWAFLVVRDPEAKRFLQERYERAMRERFGGLQLDEADRSPLTRTLRAVRHQMEHLHEAPLLLLVCGKRDWPFAVPPEKRVGKAPPNYGAMYPCVQNILLACRALGLGAALTTMHQVFEEALHERFGIPEEWGVVVMIPIGYPAGRFGPVSRRPAEEVTFFDSWERREP